MLEIKDLACSYKDVPIICGVSLAIEPGEIAALVAPNGSGKTTLMRAMADRIAPKDGARAADGIDALRRRRQYARKVLYVPDGGKLVADELTVREQLAATIRLWQSDADLEATVRQCHLESMLSKRGRQLSQGMKQQMSLAISCASHAAYLLFDEPTNGFDQGNTRRFRRIVEGLADQGCGILISSHLLNELDEMCDTTYFLKDGHLIRPHDQGYQGSCPEIYTQLFEGDEV